MKAAPFDYVLAESVDHALDLLARHGMDAKAIAGGQSLVPMMAMRLARPAVLVDINRLAELKQVITAADSVAMGAVTRQRDVEDDTGLHAAVPLLRDALRWVGHVQTRNRGTVGGSMVHADPSAEIAMGQTARSPNDGSVMMLTHMSAVATNPHLYRSVPYDSLKDFEAVGLVGDLPFVLVCHPSLPCNNVQELIAYVKANPGKLTNASSGNGTVSHLAMEEFKRRAGIDIVHVPYKGSAPGLTDVVGGTVALALETAAGVQAFVQGGKLRALGTATSKRLSAPLDVPTIAEQGFENFQAVTWLMLIYPAGTPKPLVESTFEAMAKAMRTPDVEQKLLQAGAIPRYSSSPAEADALIRSEFKSWGEVVRRSGVKLD